MPLEVAARVLYLVVSDRAHCHGGGDDDIGQLIQKVVTGAAAAPCRRGRSRPRECCGPVRSGTASRPAPPGGVRVDPGVVQDLPHSGGGDRVAEFDQFALHAPVPPRGVVGRDADHGCRGRPPRTPTAGVVPLRVTSRRCQESSVAGVTMNTSPHRRRGSAGTVPKATAGRPGGKRPGRSTAKHRVLVSQHQQFGVLGHLVPGYHHEAVEQAAREQVEDREDHPAMIPARKDLCRAKTRS